MNQHPINPARTNLEINSALIGFGAGILGTLIFATYKQGLFDSFLAKTREVAGDAEDRVDELSDHADALNAKLTRSAHREVSRANHAAKTAIDSVRTALTE